VEGTTSGRRVMDDHFFFAGRGEKVGEVEGVSDMLRSRV
jgi:hypothetical protein